MTDTNLAHILHKLRLSSPLLQFLWKIKRWPVLSLSSAEADGILQAVHPMENTSALTERPRAFRPVTCELSVIIPTYNNAPYIKACVESVLHQGGQYATEIIVIDDGSTDRTAQQLACYAGVERVQIIHQENQGVSVARNRGIDAASGRYLMFLDGDDLLRPGVIEALMDCAVSHQAALVEGGYQIIDMDGKFIREYRPPAGRVTSADQLHGFIWMKVMERSLWERLQYPMGMIHQDSVMAQILREQIMLRGQTAWRIDQPVGQYRYNMSGITQSNASRPRSIDTVWITQILLADRHRLQLPMTQTYYEHLLDMALLSWRRTSGMPLQVRQAVFAKYSGWIAAEGKGFSSRKQEHRLLEQALLDRRFSFFELYGRLHD